MTRILPASTAFDDVKPFPGENTRIHLGANEPPIEERIVLDLESEIDETPGFRTRIRELVAKAETLPECKDEETAGKLADFAKMAKTAATRVDEIRENIKRPYLTAGRNLDAKARTYTDALAKAAAAAQAKLNAFVAEQRKIAAEKAAKEAAEAAAKRQAEWEAQQAARAADEPAPSAPAPEPEAFNPLGVGRAPKAAPIATGDYGARVGTRTVWKADAVTSLKGLPKEVTGHPKVLEAANAVIASLVRGGAREIKGVVIREHTEANIR